MDKEVCEKAIIAFNEMRSEASKKGFMSEAEINAEINAYRKSKTSEAMKESQKIVESGKSRFESVEEMFENLGI